MENNLTKPARIMFALALIVFGVQHFIYQDFLPKLEPVSAWMPARMPLAYFVGAVIILAALGIATGIADRVSALVIGIMCIAFVVFFHISVLVSNLHNPDKWACFFEELAIGSGALILAGTLTPLSKKDFRNKLITTGRILFALSLIPFGIQHMMYGEFIANLIPAWIPAHIFWAYFVGIVFFAVSLSLLVKRKMLLASTLLGIMFLFWEISLHIPRVIANPHNMDQWTSASVALAMCASSFVIASMMPGEQVTAVHALQGQNI